MDVLFGGLFNACSVFPINSIIYTHGLYGSHGPRCLSNAVKLNHSLRYLQFCYMFYASTIWYIAFYIQHYYNRQISSISVCNAHMWNVNFARATAFIYDSRTDVPEKVSEFFETQNVSTFGGLEPESLDPCWMLYHFSHPGHLLSHIWNTGAGGINIFIDEFSIWNINMNGCPWEGVEVF